MCPRARLSHRRAFRAPDCARASRRRAHVSRPFLRGFFAPARNRRRSNPRTPLPPVLSYHSFPRVNPEIGIISDFSNKRQFSVTVSILLFPRQPPALPPVGRPGRMVSGAGLQTQRQRAAGPTATPTISSSSRQRSGIAPPGSEGPNPTPSSSDSTAPCSTSTSASWDAQSFTTPATHTPSLQGHPLFETPKSPDNLV